MPTEEQYRQAGRLTNPHTCEDSVHGLFADSTAIIREECQKRMEVCRVNVVEAMFSERHMNPRRAVEMLEQCIRYAQLAKLDAAELNRRLHSANVD
jgi:hypothetical protein